MESPPGASALVRLADAVMPNRVRAVRTKTIYWSTVVLQTRRANMGGSVVILGYIGSGTNWLVSLAADYLDLRPFEPWMRLTPKLGPSVIHMHRFLSSPAAQARTIYMHRDGRDAVISAYHKYLNTVSLKRSGQSFERDTGEKLDPARAAEQFPVFLEWFITQPQPASAPWPEHVRTAIDMGLPRVSFEGLKADPVGTLAPILADFTGREVDRDRLGKVIEAHRFERKQAADKSGFMRKGASGEWRELYNRKAREAFAKWGGAELIALGYEPDDSWIDRD